MAESMSHVERVLWRIAELGARCSQQTAAGGREPLWAELEQTIAGLEAEYEAASQAVDAAPAQVRNLEGRLEVARQELDQVKAKLREHRDDAEAARRERDRAVQKARKAMAITVETKSAVLDARSTAAECVARASAADNTAKKALAARDDALASRDDAVNALAEALTARDRAVQALAESVATGERAADARDEALASRDTALRALEGAHSRITELEATLEATRAEHDEAVVVLPGVAMPQAPVSPITSGNRVAWQPTWSEWSRPGDTPEDVTDVTDGVDGATEIRLDDTAAGEDRGVRRYLNVAATIAQLLPEDFGPLLMDGATVVRREGRLFATVAVPTNDWAGEPGADTVQAARFADAGFKVEWTSNAPLGV